MLVNVRALNRSAKVRVKNSGGSIVTLSPTSATQVDLDDAEVRLALAHHSAIGQWVTVPSGGSSAQVLEATVEAGPNDFLVPHTFDLGGPAVWFLEGVLTAASADGETFGTSDGDINADILSAFGSPDGVGVGISAAPTAWWRDTPYDGSQPLPHAGWQKIGITSRYVIVKANIIDFTSFNPYAGANHPTASFDLTLTAR